MGNSIEELKNMVEKDSENADLRMDLGLALAQDRQFEAAAEQFQKAVDIDPDRPKAHYNMGVIYGKFLLDDLVVDEYWEDHTDEEALFEKASACYKEALRLDPQMTAAMNNLARIQAAMGLETEAARLFEQSLKIDPGQDDVIEDLAQLRDGDDTGSDAGDDTGSDPRA